MWGEMKEGGRRKEEGGQRERKERNCRLAGSGSLERRKVGGMGVVENEEAQHERRARPGCQESDCPEGGLWGSLTSDSEPMPLFPFCYPLQLGDTELRHHFLYLL